MPRYYCIVDTADRHDVFVVETASAMKAADIYGTKSEWEMVSIVRMRTAQLISRAIYDPDIRQYAHGYIGKRVRYYEFDI